MFALECNSGDVLESFHEEKSENRLVRAFRR